MTSEEMTEIYERLLRLTQAGTLQWKRRDFSENGYSVSFPRSSAVVALDEDEQGNCRVPVLKIYSDQGRLAFLATKEPPEWDSAEYNDDVEYFALDPDPLYMAVVEMLSRERNQASTDMLNELRRIEGTREATTH